MMHRARVVIPVACVALAGAVICEMCVVREGEGPGTVAGSREATSMLSIRAEHGTPAGLVTVGRAVVRDVSPPLAEMGVQVSREGDAEKEADADDEAAEVPAGALAPQARGGAGPASTAASPSAAADRAVAAGSEAVEQTVQGNRPAAEIVASFDGLGVGFVGPQTPVGGGGRRGGNPSDNSLAVGPDHIVQTVNSQMAIFTKKGAKFDTTGVPLYGPVSTNNVFRFFGDAGQRNNGDAVVRYDQLADRWLIVMPIFSRLPVRAEEPPAPRGGEPATRSWAAVRGQPGDAAVVVQPPRPEPATGPATTRGRGRGRGFGTGPATGRGRGPMGSYAMCYAVSTTSDPLGSYYRYQFVRPLFPDYPRPAVWPDGYYVPTSTGDNVVQKHAYVVDRAKMLKGADATEQGIIVDDVNFLNNADVDGQQLPPAGAPNIMMAAGGRQLLRPAADGSPRPIRLEDDGIYVWKYHVDWDDPLKTRLEGPEKIAVAPYHYLGGGQLTASVPQPGTEVRLDSQGDKIMQRLVYRRIGDQESIVAVHSINTAAPGGGGGVRWYEFRIDAQRNVKLYQQGTYCPGGDYRWLASPAMDRFGNIGIGYSFGGTKDFPGQRFAGRLAGDPPGVLTLREAVLAEGEASQGGPQPPRTSRWEDYAQTAMDPSDDRTIWYVGDYLKRGAATYSTRIGAFRMTGGNGAN